MVLFAPNPSDFDGAGLPSLGGYTLPRKSLLLGQLWLCGALVAEVSAVFVEYRRGIYILALIIRFWAALSYKLPDAP